MPIIVSTLLYAKYMRTALNASIIAVNVIFLFKEYCLFVHTKGMAKGPMHKNATIITQNFEYHTVFAGRVCVKGVCVKTVCVRDACGGDACGKAAKNSPQCLHFIASLCISSAQKGHFFITVLL